MRARILLSFVTILICFTQSQPVDAVTFRVLPDGTGDAATIQIALDVCAEGDTILVAAGTYYENPVWPETQSLKLVSESGDEVTAIDGDGLGRVIDIRTGVDETTVIEGFSIQNGSTVGFGAGILCVYGSSPTIRHNTIAYNTSTEWGDGGGIYCSGSSPHIHDNTFVGNLVLSVGRIGGAIGCYAGSAPLIEGNHFLGNVASSGGAIGSENAAPLIRNNTFIENESNGALAQRGGAIFGAPGSDFTIIGNTFTGNSTGPEGYGGAIGVRNNNALTITGNTFTDNEAAWGGALWLSGGISFVSDNTFSNNTATTSGGAITVRNGTHTIALNDIDGNHAMEYGGAILCLFNDQSTFVGNYITNNTAGLLLGGGIYCADDAETKIQYCEISGNSDDGITCVANANPSIHHNSIMDNLGFGVRNNNTAVVVYALYNWWGDASGPGGVGPGIGDEVSEYVTFEPWALGKNPVGLTGVEPGISPVRVLLQQNYPNPFNPLTRISFAVPGQQVVRLDVYTIAGRRLATLFAGELPAGLHEFTWDGRDERDQAVASGTYLYRLSTADLTETKRMVLVR